MSYGKFDTDGWLVSVFESDDPTLGLEALLGWTVWPEAPTPGFRLRKVDNAMVWQDPRSDTEKAAEARTQRDQLLRECDWTQGRDIADAVALPWAAYRNALRNLTAQAGFPSVIDWPAAP